MLTAMQPTSQTRSYHRVIALDRDLASAAHCSHYADGRAYTILAVPAVVVRGSSTAANSDFVYHLRQIYRVLGTTSESLYWPF
jgi:hypothetical protein